VPRLPRAHEARHDAPASWQVFYCSRCKQAETKVQEPAIATRLRPALPAHQSAAAAERRSMAARDQARRLPRHPRARTAPALDSIGSDLPLTQPKLDLDQPTGEAAVRRRRLRALGHARERAAQLARASGSPHRDQRADAREDRMHILSYLRFPPRVATSVIVPRTLEPFFDQDQIGRYAGALTDLTFLRSARARWVGSDTSPNSWWALSRKRAI
jgi:hypothetical protein